MYENIRYEKKKFIGKRFIEYGLVISLRHFSIYLCLEENAGHICVRTSRSHRLTRLNNSIHKLILVIYLAIVHR